MKRLAALIVLSVTLASCGKPNDETVTLSAREWWCASSHVQHVPLAIYGKTIIPEHDVTLCDEYRRRP